MKKLRLDEIRQIFSSIQNLYSLHLLGNLMNSNVTRLGIHVELTVTFCKKDIIFVLEEAAK